MWGLPLLINSMLDTWVIYMDPSRAITLFTYPFEDVPRDSLQLIQLRSLYFDDVPGFDVYAMSFIINDVLAWSRNDDMADS